MEIGRIQVETWRTAYAALLPAEVMESVGVADAAQVWAAAVTTPPSDRHHVLVALEQDAIVGFVAIGPAEEVEEADPEPDTTAGLSALLVEPRWGRRGHGSRLLAAAVEHWRTDGFTRAVVWLPEEDAVSSGFYSSAGWARDGYVRLLDTGTGTLREIRLHVSLATEDAQRGEVSA